jgi:uncharacterized protein
VATVNDDAFHEGERAAQARVGVRDRLAVVGSRAIRGFLLEQHRQFFAQLPLILLGMVDELGQPWASVLAGHPGFVVSPDPQHLFIRARLLHADPLSDALIAGAPIGLLGIEPHTRRRNRLNGIVESMTAGSFTVRVHQSFGNCPQYIQARAPEFAGHDVLRDKLVHRAESLDEAMCRLIGSADTLYIATAFGDARADIIPQHGIDVSHRGGKPGFVRIDNACTLTMPDFLGNSFFNTIGNILLNPRAGLLFIDFATGDLVYLAVDAEIIWDGDEVKAFLGAERLLRFGIRQAMRVEASLPLRWGAAEFSPLLQRTGSWEAPRHR